MIVSADNLKNLTINRHNITEILPRNIKNVKKFTIPSEIFRPLAVLFPLAATSLTYLEITGDVLVSDLPDLSNIVQSHPTLEVLNINRIQPLSWEHNLVSPLVEAAGNSQLKKLIIGKCDIIELINYANTNPKELIISDLLIQPLAALLPNITSLTYLEITGDVSDSDLPVLANIVRSHPTLEVLNIVKVRAIDLTKLSLLVEAAINSQLKEIRVYEFNYDQLPSHFREAHKQLLQPYTR